MVGNCVIITTMLDHLLHHGITVSIRRHWDRLKEKIKSDLLKGVEAKG